MYFTAAIAIHHSKQGGCIMGGGTFHGGGGTSWGVAYPWGFFDFGPYLVDGQQGGGGIHGGGG